MSVIGTTSILLLMIAIVIMFILIFIFFTGKYEKHEVSNSSYALGTLISLRASGNKAEEAIEESLIKLNDIDDKMSAFKENSEISKINLNAGIASETVSKDTYFVIENAIKYSKILEGTFDPTIRPLVKLWNIGTKEENIPEQSKIGDVLKLVNYNDVILNESNNSIMLKHKNQALDVGGIPKGFVAVSN